MTNLSLKLAKISSVSQTFALILAIIAQTVIPFKAQAIDTTKVPAFEQKTTTIAMVGYDTPVAAPAEVVVPPAPKPDKTIAAVFTAYTSTPDQTDSDPFIAASGKHVYMGMVANNCLPMGTKLKLTFADEALQAKYGGLEYMVDDRMNSRYGCNRFDIWLDAPRKEAMQFGVRRVTVEVFNKKKTAPVAKVKPAKKVVEIAGVK